MTLKKSLLSYCLRLSSIIVGLTLAGCATDNAQSSGPAGAGTDHHSAAQHSDSDEDPLYPSDKITISFSGTVDLIPSIDQMVSGDGNVSVPYLGAVHAAGETPSELARELTAKYIDGGYYRHISVTVVPTTRFIYVTGQVNPGPSGGRIPCSGPMTVTDAIAAAGDFTPFANRKKVRLIRRKDNKIIIINCVEALRHPEKDPQVYPGDHIDVPRRPW